MPNAKIDTFNKFFVAMQGGELCFLRPVPQRLSKQDALLLAAYLVSMSRVLDPMDLEFIDVLEALENA